MESSYISGNAYIRLSEQNNYNQVISDGVIDEEELLSMSLMYEGSETSVKEMLEKTDGFVKLQVYHGDIEDASDIEIKDMSAYGTKATTTKGYTQEELYNKLIEDMILDEIKKSLKEVAEKSIN